MKVRIAFVTDETGGIDTDRVGAIEDIPDDEAKRLIREFVAVEATARDVEEYEARLAYERSTVENGRAADIDAVQQPISKPRRGGAPVDNPGPADAGDTQ